MILAAPNQSSVDHEHLRVLSVLYFVYGGLAACICLAALLFLFAGAIAVAGGAASAPPSSAPWNAVAAGAAGCVFAAIGGGLCVLFGTAAALRILTGLALRQRRYYTFCLVVAGIMTLQIPLGALLGVSTLIVLLRPSVARLFSERDALELETAGEQITLRPVRGTGPLTREHGVWVFRTGQALPAAATDAILQQLREEHDRANLGDGE